MTSGDASHPALLFFYKLVFIFIEPLHLLEYHLFFFFLFFLMWTIFKVFIEFVTLLLLLLCFGFFFFFGRKACGILAPQPGIEPATPALEGDVLTTGPPGKSRDYLLIKKKNQTSGKKEKTCAYMFTGKD